MRHERLATPAPPSRTPHRAPRGGRKPALAPGVPGRPQARSVGTGRHPLPRKLAEARAAALPALRPGARDGDTPGPLMYLGLDLGTSGLKGLLMGADGAVIAEASAPLAVSRPASGWSEQDPADWIAAAESVLAALAADPGLESLEGIGL